MRRLTVTLEERAYALAADADALRDRMTVAKMICAHLRVVENDALERAVLRTLEQRCERGTGWDLACVTIAEKIRALKHQN
jgi:hypothetical protein